MCLPIAAIILLTFLVFLMFRCIAGLIWNEVLFCHFAEEIENGMHTPWYITANPGDFIFKPKRWYMWTPGQYERFLKIGFGGKK